MLDFIEQAYVYLLGGIMGAFFIPFLIPGLLWTGFKGLISHIF